MTSIAIDLGDKFIFDQNDALNPNSTFMTNPSSATNPNNTIEVWCNGNKRAEFQNTKMILAGDLEFSATTAFIRPTGGTLVFDFSSAYTVKFNSGGVKQHQISSSAIEFGTPLYLVNSSAAQRRVKSNIGSLDIEADGELTLRSNWQNHGASQVTIRDFNTQIAQFDSTNGLTVATTIFAGGSISAIGVINGSVSGLRTKAISGQNPQGGNSGEIQVRTDNNKLFVNVAGTWKSVTLA